MNKEQKLEELDRKYIWHPFTQMQEFKQMEPEPLIIEKGEGSYLIDKDGNRYLDGISSLWVTVHGHNRAEINEAIVEQVHRISHTTLLGLSNDKAILLAQRLCQVAPEGLSHVFYSDNGSTAVEASLKIALQYWQQSGKPSKSKFMSFEGAYHGDTIGSVSLGGIDLFHEKYGSLTFGCLRTANGYCYRCKFSRTASDCKMECFEECERVIEKNHEELAAVIIEPLMQGAAGMIAWPKGFLAKLRGLCDRLEVLLIADEVATGFGRTGAMFACAKENISPDIMALAKGITGGYLPLAATLVTDKVYSAFLGDYSDYKTFFHGHTYTGNPLACAAALASLAIFEKDNVIEGMQSKIELLNRGLSKFRELDNVGDIRSCGFMTGIELVEDKETKKPFDPVRRIGYKVILEARKRGLILRPLGDVIVLMPPISVSEGELGFLLGATYESIRETVKNDG